MHHSDTDFCIHLQKFLMKKNQEYGALKDLLSRATAESNNNINEIVNGVTEIFNTHIILPEEIDKRIHYNCVESYKYFLLNTHFNVQQLLAEDLLNGYMVDMCPPISPYIFMQIIWKLKMEVVLIESILYIPLDLCIEVLEVMNRYIEELEFERAIYAIFLSMLNIYKKCLLLSSVGSQTRNITEGTRNLVAIFQMLLNRLSSEKIIASDLPNLKRCEQYGLILRKTIYIVKLCMDQKENIVHNINHRCYKLTFGREIYHKLEPEFLKSIICILDDELMALLLSKVKEIDCDIYLGWAEIDDSQNPIISLQRAIAIDCHYFVQFMTDNETLSQNNHLKECLHQFFKPDSLESSKLTLEEICHGISNGKTSAIEELMSRYKEWDQTTLDFITTKSELLTKKHFDILFEYLDFISSKPDNKEAKTEVFIQIITSVFDQELGNIYNITTKYVLTHINNNYLNMYWNQEKFEFFLKYNAEIYTKVQFCTFLMFFMFNPKEVLHVLLKILIGYPEYSNVVCSVKTLWILRPFLLIQNNYQVTLLILCLQEVCMENKQWNFKKFTDFMQIILKQNVATADDLMNNIFIPYLSDSSFHWDNMNCILHNIRKAMPLYRNVDLVKLFISIAKRLSEVRKSNLLRSECEEQFVEMLVIIGNFMKSQPTKLTIRNRRQIIDSITVFIEPLDKTYFTPLWHLLNNSIMDLVNGYERRCHPIFKKAKINQNVSSIFRAYISDIKLDREAFLRHIFLQSIGVEYEQYCYEVITMFYFFFGWTNEIDSVDNILRITMETIQLSLEYPIIATCDAFVYLLLHVVILCRDLINNTNINSFDIYKLLKKNIYLLKEVMSKTPYSSEFDCLITNLNNISGKDGKRCLEKAFRKIDSFNDECQTTIRNVQNILAIFTKKESSKKISSDITIMYKTHKFICACLKVSDKEAYRCINKMDKLLFPQ